MEDLMDSRKAVELENAYTTMLGRKFKTVGVGKRCTNILECKNENYWNVFETLDSWVQEDVLKWIKDDLGMSSKKRVGDKIGDLFEFASLYFIGLHQEKYLLSMIAFTYRMQFGPRELQAATRRDKRQTGVRGSSHSARRESTEESYEETSVCVINTEEAEASRVCVTCYTPCTDDDNCTVCQTCNGE